MVSVAEGNDETYVWLAHRLGEVAGTDYRLRLIATRDRLRQARRVDAHQVEVGVWRVCLEDLLSGEPDIVEDLWILGQDAIGRVAAR